MPTGSERSSKTPCNRSVSNDGGIFGERSDRAKDAVPQNYARAVQSISMSNSMGQEATGTKVRDGGSLGK